MRKVLFVVSIFNYHREVLPAVEAFRRNDWQVTAAIGWSGQTADEAASVYAAMGCRVFRLPDDMAYKVEAKTEKANNSPSRNGSKRPSKTWLLRRLVSLLLMPLRLLKLRRRMVALMDDLGPDLVFQGPYHSCARFDNGFAHEARRRGIKRCCYPVSAYHGRRTVVLARFSNLAMGMLPPILRADYDPLNRFLAQFFPEWTQTRDGLTIFMWEPVTMLAAWLTGLMDHDVWQKPSPDFDTVFVFNDYSRKLLEANDFPMDKVVVSGIPLLDVAVARAADPVARCRMLGDLGLADGERFLLFNVEPSAEHHYCDGERHWANFRALMQVVTRQNFPVVLSLHPLCRVDEYAFAEKEFGVRISRERKIYDLYPLCALAVSFPCSTNLIAEVFDKPLVIYDFFRMAHEASPRAGEYRLPGARIGHDVEQVEEHVRGLCAALQAEAEMRRMNAAPPAPTYVLATSVMLDHADRLLEGRPDRGFACCV